MTLTATRVKETKNKVVYAEQHAPDDYATIGSIYVSRQWAARHGNPETITLTLEAA